MRVFLVILFNFLCYTVTVGQFILGISGAFALKGKVKSIARRECGFFGTSSVAPDGYLCHDAETVKYDTNGRKAENISYTIGDTIVSRDVIIYNDEGNIKEVDTYDGKNILEGKHITVYKNKGMQVEDYSQFLGDTSKHLYFVESLDSNKNVLESTTYIRGNKISSRSKNRYVYKYDAKKRLIETNNYDSTNKYIGRKTNLYDSGGHLIEVAVFDSKNKCINKDDSFFSPSGHLIKQSGFNINDKIYFEYFIKYDNKGKMTEMYDSAQDENGRSAEMIDSLNVETDKVYNKKGKLVGFPRIIKYQFDKEGNWIRADEYLNNRRVSYITEAIEYY